MLNGHRVHKTVNVKKNTNIAYNISQINYVWLFGGATIQGLTKSHILGHKRVHGTVVINSKFKKQMGVWYFHRTQTQNHFAKHRLYYSKSGKDIQVIQVCRKDTKWPPFYGNYKISSFDIRLCDNSHKGSSPRLEITCIDVIYQRKFKIRRKDDCNYGPSLIGCIRNRQLCNI